MTLDPAIFKAYDVRGTYPDEIEQPLAHGIGRLQQAAPVCREALAQHLGPGGAQAA